MFSKIRTDVCDGDMECYLGGIGMSFEIDFRISQ